MKYPTNHPNKHFALSVPLLNRPVFMAAVALWPHAVSRPPLAIIPVCSANLQTPPLDDADDDDESSDDDVPDMELDILNHVPNHQERSNRVSEPHRVEPIVVTYGPFHHPDADVAVPYAQMVCYLWFWSSSIDPANAALQFQPQPHFVHFLRRVITQTQLSKTVLVLALHYLWLLKRPFMHGAGSHERSMGPVPPPSEFATAQVHSGSQYTVSVIALMLANKFMDE